jgi:hypothetical protein
MSNVLEVKKTAKKEENYSISERCISKCDTCRGRLEGIDGGSGVIICYSNLNNCPSYRKSRTVK